MTRIDRSEEVRSVDRMRLRARTYRERYGDLEDLAPLERLDKSLATRMTRIEHLRKMAAEIHSEIRAFEVEIAGIERGIEALLGETLPKIAARFNEAWSPTAVMGYRLWAIGDDGMHGVRARWEAPQFVAECADSSNIDIPHTDGRCGRLGCGVYAAKDVGRLIAEFTPALNSTFAVGLVALDGKVVEHEHGYRAARATVSALAAVQHLRAEFTSSPERLDALFSAGPIDAAATTHPDRAALFAAIVTYLTAEERKHDPWISENKNG